MSRLTGRLVCGEASYYAPGLGATYAARSWVASAVIFAIGVPVTLVFGLRNDRG